MLCDTVDNRDKFAPLRILSFDLECEVRPDGQFSSAQHQAVIQIGNMVSTYGIIVPTHTFNFRLRMLLLILGCDPPFHRNIFTLKSCSRISGPNVYSFEDESKMLMAWRAFFVELDPDIVIGYNITQFDIPYLLNRAEALNLHDFPFFGRIKGGPLFQIPVFLDADTSCATSPAHQNLVSIYQEINVNFIFWNAPDMMGDYFSTFFTTSGKTTVDYEDRAHTN